jgi:hypothetical protein
MKDTLSDTVNRRQTYVSEFKRRVTEFHQQANHLNDIKLQKRQPAN